MRYNIQRNQVKSKAAPCRGFMVFKMTGAGCCILLLLLLFPGLLPAQVKASEIKEMIANYRNIERGPYRDIRWFCADGTFVEPKESCNAPGDVQRARYKEEVIKLGASNHVFLGQILSKTPKEDFWDIANNHSRLKQYMLEKYLRAVDDGWVLHKAQYYRGAYQVQDEEAWGKEFLRWALRNDEKLNSHFFLLRETAKELPHRGEDKKTQSIRVLSKTIAERFSRFQNLRVKIHGQPDIYDLAKVKAFREKYGEKMAAPVRKDLDQLIADMQAFYQPAVLEDLLREVWLIPKGTKIRGLLAAFIGFYKNEKPGAQKSMAAADMMIAIRENIHSVKTTIGRLALLDISIALEEMIRNESYAWKTETLEALLEKNCYLGMAATGAGYLELWEWQQIEGDLAVVPDADDFPALNFLLDRTRSVVEWGTGMNRGTYKDVVGLFAEFEPLANGFYDDKLRSSVLLPMGSSTVALGDFIAKESGLANYFMGLPSQSRVRGLNPGYAMGELVVVDGATENLAVDPTKIYVFNYPASNLKPVAGIATVTEGNIVSHVQLLARNLGIPNAVIAYENLQDIKRFSGQKVFYAVTGNGRVVMKPADEMNARERQLFVTKQRAETRIRVPLDKLDLAQQNILDLRNLKASDSGKWCGPKAANLGQLKSMFPENVVDGIVIPFGVFRQHLDQEIPGKGFSYWEYLNWIFDSAEKMRQQKQSEKEVEQYLLVGMDSFRNAVQEIKLLPEFEQAVKDKFKAVLGKEMGSLPVFVRSDTNMEDLKDFTGAGLNLTLFNVVDADKILQGIRAVWASPYKERSFKWRQSYLLNPEHVYPSILIIPTVDVQCSGVLITKGVTSGSEQDLTIAFSLGAGGAVDGQAAESYLLKPHYENILLSPAREPFYRRLPATGGSTMLPADFSQRILSESKLIALREMAYQIETLLPETPGIATAGPFDVELGFDGERIFLFQVRPFVERLGDW